MEYPVYYTGKQTIKTVGDVKTRFLKLTKNFLSGVPERWVVKGAKHQKKKI